MNINKLIFPAFILFALVQLYVPAKMIFGREDILKTGTEFKFRTAPMDPNDPFRGKYIELEFSASTFETEEADEWIYEKEIFVSLSTDEKGYAKIESISREKPDGTMDYVIAKVSRIITSTPKRVVIQYPFDRYYMEEYKAPDAEQVFRDAQRDDKQETWALVNMKNGEAVLKDVLIGGISIKDIAEGHDE